MHHQDSASAISSSSSPSTSIWAVMNSWFSPTVLFFILNLIIGTIAYTSWLTNQKKLTSSPSLLQRIKSFIFIHGNQLQSQENDGSSSLKKPSESHYFFHENLRIFHESSSYHEIPAIFASKNSVFDDFQRPHYEGAAQKSSGHVIGEACSNSDIDFSDSQEENGQETPAHFVFHGKDSFFDDFHPSTESKDKAFEDHEQNAYIASFRSYLGRVKAVEDIHSVEARRPKTARERSGSKVSDGDAEVDSKADDFINRFKHQLKLQRVDSIVRYRDAMAKGSQ